MCCLRHHMHHDITQNNHHYKTSQNCLLNYVVIDTCIRISPVAYQLSVTDQRNAKICCDRRCCFFFIENNIDNRYDIPTINMQYKKVKIGIL